MAFDIKSMLELSGNALQIRAQRTVVLASNLANLNTPGYQARDIDVLEGIAHRDRMREPAIFSWRSGPGGIETMSDSDPPSRYRVPFHSGQDGNTVELGVEQAAFAENAAAFQVSLAFLNLKIKGLHAAISGNA